MPARLDIDLEKIRAFCHKWSVAELMLFGSVLRDDFRDDSDVDLLVTFTDDSHWTLLDRVTMEDELRQIIGRDVDLVSRRGIERSVNPLRKRAILSTAERLYAKAG